MNQLYFTLGNTMILGQPTLQPQQFTTLVSLPPQSPCQCLPSRTSLQLRTTKLHCVPPNFTEHATKTSLCFLKTTKLDLCYLKATKSMHLFFQLACRQCEIPQLAGVKVVDEILREAGAVCLAATGGRPLSCRILLCYRHNTHQGHMRHSGSIHIL